MCGIDSKVSFVSIVVKARLLIEMSFSLFTIVSTNDRAAEDHQLFPQACANKAAGNHNSHFSELVRKKRMRRACKECGLKTTMYNRASGARQKNRTEPTHTGQPPHTAHSPSRRKKKIGGGEQTKPNQNQEQQSSRAAEQQSSRAAEQQSSRAAEQQSSRAAAAKGKQSYRSRRYQYLPTPHDSISFAISGMNSGG
jgi:hypothetical protein